MSTPAGSVVSWEEGAVVRAAPFHSCHYLADSRALLCHLQGMKFPCHLPSSSTSGKRLEMQQDHNYHSHVTALTNTLGMTNITPIQLAKGLITVCHVEMNVMALKRRCIVSVASKRRMNASTSASQARVLFM